MDDAPAWIEKARNITDSKAFVTLSYAQSLNGLISLKNQQIRISSQESSILTHVLRSRNDAILVGINTIEIDDPLLNTRLVDGPSPRVIILDSSLKIKLSARVLTRDASNCIIFCKANAVTQKLQALVKLGCTVIPVDQDDGFLDLNLVLQQCRNLNVQSIMVEGGATILNQFFKHQLVDLVYVTISSKFIPENGNDGVRVDGGSEYKTIEWHQFGPDVVMKGLVY